MTREIDGRGVKFSMQGGGQSAGMADNVSDIYSDETPSPKEEGCPTCGGTKLVEGGDFVGGSTFEICPDCALSTEAGSLTPLNDKASGIDWKPLVAKIAHHVTRMNRECVTADEMGRSIADDCGPLFEALGMSFDDGWGFVDGDQSPPEPSIANPERQPEEMPLKLLDRADDEAIDWITSNCMAIRRDDGSLHYSLSQIVRAFQAGKAVATPSSQTNSDVNAELLKDSNSWYSASQLEEIEGFPTHGAKPEGLGDSETVEVKYVTGRWVSGKPAEHQWDRITHYRLVPTK